MIPSDPVVVVARWKTSEAHLGAVLELVKTLRTKTLAEPGCLGYDVFEQVGERGALLLLERYRDGAAAEAHRSSAHYQRFAGSTAVASCLRSMPRTTTRS